jgi:hypothetical protein
MTCCRCLEAACVVYTRPEPVWNGRQLWFCLSCWYRRRVNKEALMK